ncbi:DinB family protein [Actinokineospora sp. PR83]|uniref:mycothiol transferase n=1 Tax=Actinokineospora sp. PR83 TaxID=2884908 RepID=UPI001F22329E|nr:DUF664 domain-containing protein [Actinokineospora sp. PR83]MCG8917354.1 DinB family protein [Actinokineospora sp. PR83]
MPNDAETTATPDAERVDLLAALAKARAALIATTSGLDDEQAAARPTAGELCLGGLVKHVTAVPDLSVTHPLPDAPWHEPAGGVLSARGALLHVLAETTRHAGILREALDARKSS